MGQIQLRYNSPPVTPRLALAELPVKSFDFSGGEIQVRLATDHAPKVITFTAFLTTSHDIIELLMLADAAQRAYPAAQRNLLCPYLPYARQDRVCAPGEAFSLEVICRLINGAGFDAITVWDVHSQVSLDLLDNVTNVPVVDLIDPWIIGDAVLVCPDKGAVDRVSACAERFKRPMIIADKVRDPSTGAITHTELHMNGIDVTGKDLIMIDDICDGGRTFIEHAKLLRPLTTGRISLWVTHLIASQGFEVFHGLIDNIYTANCFRSELPSFVQVIR